MKERKLVYTEKIDKKYKRWQTDKNWKQEGKIKNSESEKVYTNTKRYLTDKDSIKEDKFMNTEAE